MNEVIKNWWSTFGGLSPPAAAAGSTLLRHFKVHRRTSRLEDEESESRIVECAESVPDT